MPSQGPRSPSSASGTGWVNPTNVFALDGVFATQSTIASSVYSTLNITNYGFSLPTNATIVGIIAIIYAKVSGGNVTDNGVTLLGNGATADRSNGLNIPTSVTAETYGNSSDSWGVSWSVAQINSSAFGVAYNAVNNGPGTQILSIDYSSIQVFYTVPPTKFFSVLSGVDS